MTDQDRKASSGSGGGSARRADESDGTVTINIGLWPVLGLAVVVGGLLIGVWLARSGLQSNQADVSQSVASAVDEQSIDSAPADLPGAPPGAGDIGAAVQPASGADGQDPAASSPIEITASPEVEVLALLDGNEITSREIDLELVVQAAVRSQSGMSLNSDADSIERFRREILEHVLDQRALIAAADEAGIVVSDLDATAGISTMGSQLGVDGTMLYEAALEAGITDAEYLDWSRGQLAIERFLSSDAARQISMEAMADKGVPADQAELLPTSREDVAARVTAESDIVLIVDGEQVTPVVVGELAPDVELMGLDGQPVLLSDFRGQPVVLNFWATWCVPCRIEMPTLQRAHEKYGDEITILGASVDEPAELVLEYAETLGLTFPLVLDPNADVARLYRVRAMPTTYFIDADGIVVEGHRGAVRSDEELAPLLQTVLPSAQSMVR